MFGRHLAVLFLLSLASACRAQSSPSSAAATRATAPVAARDLVPVHLLLRKSLSGFRAPARLVVRDSVAWRRVWATLTANQGSLRPPLPAVDFSREMVLVAARGYFPNAEYGITVDSAALRADTLHAYVTLVDLGLGCGPGTPAAVSVAVAVRVPVTTAAVTFVDSPWVNNCEWRPSGRRNRSPR